MASKDERKLARRIVDLGNRLDAARAKQLPHTSISLDDGTEQGLTEGVTAALDAYTLAEAHDEELVDLSGISDHSAVESTFLPERIAATDASADAGFDTAFAALERALAAKAEIEIVRSELETKLAEFDTEVANATQLIEAAKQRADEAFGAAGEAKTDSGLAIARADTALTVAGTKSKILFSTENASGTALENDLWRKIDANGDVLQEWRYSNNAWVEGKLTTTAIANLDVGKLTVGTGVISDLVAQHLAARTATFMQLSVDKLTATGSATIAQAVIEKLWADVVKAKLLTVTEKIIANDIFAAGVVGASALSATAVDGKTITGALVRTAATGQRVQLDSFGLRTFNALGNQTALLSATSGGMRLTGSFEMSRGVGGSSPWAYINDTEFAVAEQQSGGGATAHLRPYQVSTTSISLPASPNYTRGSSRLTSGGPNGGGSPGLDFSALGGASLMARAGTDSVLFSAADGDLTLAASTVGKTVFLRGSRIYQDADTVSRKGDLPWNYWSSGQWGTYGTGWSNLLSAPYNGVRAAVKEGIFYLSIALQKASGHVGSEVILRIKPEYRPPEAMMQFAWASGVNFIVAQPDGDVIVAVARAGSGNLTGSLLSWPLN